VYKSVAMALSGVILTRTSRKATCDGDCSDVRLMVGRSEFACSMKLESSSLVPVQIRKMSSINLYQTKGFIGDEDKRSYSNLPMNMLA
jgi:hypothetical protein